MFSSRFHPLRVSSGAVGKNIYNGKGGSAPSTPDYTALANAQGANNLALAQYTTQANRVNQVTPYGNITYSQGSPTVDQSGYDAALQAYNQQLAAQNQSNQRNNYSGYNSLNNLTNYGNFNKSNKSSLTAPNIADYTKGSNQWTATQTLSPAQQAILESGQNLSQGKLGYAQDILNKAQLRKSDDFKSEASEIVNQ